MKDVSTWSITLRTVVISLVLGGTTGILAAALTTNYLTEYKAELERLTAPLRPTTERPRAFPQSYAEAVRDAREQVVPASADIFPATPTNYRYPTEEAVARGVALTSDGWILTVLPPDTETTGLQVVVGGEAYEVERVVPDSATPAVFLKTSAQNLPVLAFGDGYNVRIGEQMFLIPEREALVPTAVQQIERVEDSLADALPGRSVVIAEGAEETSIGASVINLSGELIGIVAEPETYAATLLPIDTILPSFQRLLRTGEIQRASLGVKTLDLAHAIGISNELSRGRQQGALITGEQAVIAGSAAAQAGLRAGDIILSVNSQTINSQRSLGEYLLEYAPGDRITLALDRAGERREVEVVLDPITAHSNSF